MYGPVCTTCTDPITQTVTRRDCPDCYGTGTVPGYDGPVLTWGDFSADRQTPERVDAHSQDTREYSLRIVAAPAVAADDIIVDRNTDRRYNVRTVTNLMEIRRVPVVQELVVRDINRNDTVYRLPLADGTDYWG